jgi:hypothetical protein
MEEKLWFDFFDFEYLNFQQDSPYLIRHPYLLNDFYNQVEWVRELAELKTSVRQQQVFINLFFDNFY